MNRTKAKMEKVMPFANTLNVIRSRFCDPSGILIIYDEWDSSLVVEYDRDNREFVMLSESKDGEFIVFENTDTFDGPEGQVIVYRGTSRLKAVRAFLGYEPKDYAWHKGTDLYYNRVPGAKKITLIR